MTLKDMRIATQKAIRSLISFLKKLDAKIGK